MGNRGGSIHDPASRKLSARRWASKRWIACRLALPGRPSRAVWGAGYTELFFLDEATALAAGHRPCFECRRAEARRFASLWAEANGTSPDPGPIPVPTLRTHAAEPLDLTLSPVEGRGQRAGSKHPAHFRGEPRPGFAAQGKSPRSAALVSTTPEPPRPASADAIDARLHAERLASRRTPPEQVRLRDIAIEGAAVEADGCFLMLAPAGWREWRHDGYRPPPLGPDAAVRLVTPPGILAVLAAGYPPLWHETALA